MSLLVGIVIGFATAVVARRLLVGALLFKLGRDVRAINGGDHRPLLNGFADDAVILFNDGPHRFSGVHRGRAEIDRFLRNFASAGIQGEIKAIWIGGFPWALSMVTRFDDGATGASGERLYENRTAIVVRTRWGRIVEMQDFYEDTDRIAAFDRRLVEMGIQPAD